MSDVNGLQSINTWTDLSGFSALHQQAKADSKAALPVVAKQFESIFTQMMLKSMRDANFGDSLTDSQAGDSWQGLADQQLSVTLSQGHGLGIADMLIRQLGGKTTPPVVADPHAAPDPKTASPDSWRARLGSVEKVGSSAAQALSGWVANDAADFVTRLAPFASKVAQQLGVSVRAVLAQAALETQWGKHMPAHADGSSSNNLFGMKAGRSWDGASVKVPTLEFQDGVAVQKQAQFRSYESPAQSFEDYAQLVGGNPRYAQALGKGDDVAGFARGLIDGGYATDPTYVAKITTIANSPLMRQALEGLKKLVALPITSP